MKKRILAAALSLTINISHARPHQLYARSFMATRPANQHLSTQQAVWHSVIYNKTGAKGSALRAIGLYQQSVPMNKTAHYFLPPCTDQVFVAGDDTPPDVKCSRNVRAEWIGLDPQFRGSFTIQPVETQYGFSLDYNQNLCELFDLDFLKDYWISITVPVLAVHHSLNLQQQLLNAPTPPKLDAYNSLFSDQPQTIKQAFNQSAWDFAKINNCANDVVRPTEIKLQIGNALISKDYIQFAYNTILVAPMGNKQDARTMFPAIAGNNQHFGFGAAIFFQFPINNKQDSYGVCFFTNFESIFNIRNTQYRTLDLRNKPWSRYMLYNERCSLVNKEPGRQLIPGVNLLTHRVLVRPYGVFDFSMGWRFINETIEAEFGYNIWGKSNERVELPHRYNHPCEYPRFFGIAGSKPNTTASSSTVAQQGPDDPVFTVINEVYDLDPQSGASGSVLNHKVHGSVGARRVHENYTAFFAAGTYLDIPQKNTSLQVWGVWLTGGASF